MKLDNYLFILSRNLLFKVTICIGLLIAIIIMLVFTIRMDTVVEANGKLSPIDYSIIYSACEGKILSQNFVNNQSVKRGQLLAIFDTLDIKQQILILENDIAISEKRMDVQEKEIEEDLIIQRNNKENSQYDLKNEIMNYKLILPNYVPTLTSENVKDLNIDEYSPEDIKNNLVLLQKKNLIEKIKNNITNTEILLKQLSAKKQNLVLDKMEIDNKYISLERMKSEFRKRFIYSDCDGIITSDNSNSYHNRNFRIGEALLQIHKPNWEAIVQIPEESLSKVKENQKVDIRINSFNFLEYNTFSGILESISNKNSLVEGVENSKKNYYEGKVRINDVRINDFALKKDVTINARIITNNDIIINLLKKEILETGKDIF